MMKNQLEPTIKIRTSSVQESEALGEILGRLLQDQDVITLDGQLGAGKTALVRGLARGWGSPDRVTSPTYVLINQYERPGDHLIFYHLDCYRLDSEGDAETLGLEDILAAGGPLVIEWAERIASWLPADALHISLSITGVYERDLHLGSGGPRSAELLTQLQHQLAAA